MAVTILPILPHPGHRFAVRFRGVAGILLLPIPIPRLPILAVTANANRSLPVGLEDATATRAAAVSVRVGEIRPDRKEDPVLVPTNARRAVPCQSAVGTATTTTMTCTCPRPVVELLPPCRAVRKPAAVPPRPKQPW